MLNQDQAQLAVMDYAMQASILEQDGQAVQAIDIYKRALKLDKESALLNLLVSQNYYELGNDTLAVLYARRAVRLEPDNSDNRLMLGNAYMMARELVLSLKQYIAAAKLKPDNPDIAITTAGLFEALGKRDSAIMVMKDISQRTNDPDIMMQLGSMLMRDRQSGGAKDIYRRVLEMDTLNVKAWVSLAAIYEVKQQLDSALYFYGTAGQIDPDNMSIQKHIFNILLSVEQYNWAIQQALSILEREPGNAALRLQLGRLFYHQQEFQAAKEQFLVYLESDSSNTEAIYTVGRISFQQKEYQQALQYFYRTTELLPKMPEGWTSLGNCYLALDLPDSARFSFEKARRQGLKQGVDQLMGAGYSIIEKYREAIPYFQKTYQKESKDPDLMFGLAVAYERNGDFDSAAAVFEKLIKLEPKNHVALNYLGYMYADKGINLDKAKELIAKALELDPGNAFYIDSMGWVLYRLGEFEKARENIEKAVELLPNDATLHDHMGDVYLSLEMKQQALEQWQKTLELDPSKEKIKEKIDAIR
jgi:tetratricopeptide (TPR) repeat protein